MLQSIVEDLKEDDNLEFKTKKDGVQFISTVNYPNNKSLVRQNVYVDKNGNIIKVEVIDKEGNPQIVMNFEKQEYNKKFDKNYFDLNSLLKINQDTNKGSNNSNNSNGTSSEKREESNDTGSNSSEQTSEGNTTDDKKEESSEQDTSKTKTTASIGDIVYPMYLPNNTYLTSQEKVSTKDGERLILTFGGDSSFVLVEEVSKVSDENEVVPVSGEFDFLTDVIGIIDTHSLSWHSNGIDYYMASDVIETSELIDIARSISILPVSK